jgi:hypothetical protein
MARRPDDTNGSGRYNKARSTRSEPPESAELERRRNSIDGNPAALHFRGRIRVARIETEPMTTTQYHDAVDALAALIARVWDDQPGASAA